MNAPIIDLLQGDFPEVIETYLEHGVMKCIAFNRRGTLLAAGCSDGICVIWDFQTRGIAKELKDEDCVAAITSICWSKSGHHILVSSADNSLTLWNVAKGKKVFQTSLQQTPLVARLHSGGCGSSPPSLCLVSPFSSAPFILDFRTKTTTSLPISFSESVSNKFPDRSAHYTPTAACFNKHGDLVYLGNSEGEILIIDHKNNKICGIVQISGGSVIKDIVFSRNGMYLLTNSSDRIIRIYENRLPLKDSLKTIELSETRELENLKEVGSKCLSLFREFQDSVTKLHWKAPCFSGDSEWVVGGSASKGEHKIYIWDRAGLLVKILEGPKEALVDLAWHPVKPIVVTVSETGLLYIWVKDYIEHWSAFAPDFRELEQNEEYVENEDEFDLRSGTKKVKESYLNEDDEVDITTVEKDLTFSDSDISEEELCYLPVHPFPDVPENLLENSESGSPLTHDLSEPEYNIIVHSPCHPCVDVQEKLPESNKSESPLSHHSSETEGNNIVDGRLHPCLNVPGKLLESNKSESPLSHDSSDTKYAIVCHPCPDVPEELLESNNCGSSLSHDARELEVLANFAAEDAGGTHLKKRRKRTKRLLELQDLKGTQETQASDYHNMKIVISPNGDESLLGVKEVKSPTNRNELRSMVWNHFKKVKKPDQKILAVCNYCSRTFVAGNAGKNTGTNNLRIHLKTKHAELIGFVDSCNKKRISTPKDLSLTVFEEVQTPIHRKSKSMVWDHFKEFKKPDKEIVVVCNYCSRSYVAGHVGNNTLRYHLRRKHAEIFGEAADCSHKEIVSVPNGDESVSVPNGDESVSAQNGNESVSGCQDVKPPPKKKQRSIDGNEYVSGCEDVKPPPKKKQRSMVWHHYKQVKKPNNKTVAICNYCSRNFVAGSAGTNHLRNHLKRKHAKHVELIVSQQS